jgi:hypothetical protein
MSLAVRGEWRGGADADATLYFAPLTNAEDPEVMDTP